MHHRAQGVGGACSPNTARLGRSCRPHCITLMSSRRTSTVLQGRLTSPRPRRSLFEGTSREGVSSEVNNALRCRLPQGGDPLTTMLERDGHQLQRQEQTPIEPAAVSSDGNPSLVVYERDEHFHCYGCRAHGDA